MRNKKNLLILSLTSSVVCTVIYLFNLLQPFENRAFDQLSRALNPEKPDSTNIVIIEVDQHSLDEMSRQGIQWPWPRQLYAPIVEYTSKAKGVFIDILYTEPSSYGKEDDYLFSESLRIAQNVYLPVFLTNQQKALSDEEISFLKNQGLFPFTGTGLIKKRYQSAILPIEELRLASKGVGNVTLSPDEDGVYRRIPLLFGFRDGAIKHFLIPFFLEIGRAKIGEDRIIIDNKPLALYEGNALIKYYKNPKPFKEIQASEVLKSYSDSMLGKKASLDRDFFKDKFVFLGLTAAGLYDLKPTAVSSISTGLLIHATLFDNIINGSLFKPIPKYIILLLIILVCFVVTTLSMKYHSFVANLALFIAMLSAVLLLLTLFFKAGYYENLTSPLSAVIISFIMAIAFSYATEGKERRFVKRAFSQYMDEKVVDYLLKHPEHIQPGGRRSFVTVFFADIAGFTTIAEQLSPEDTAKMLRRVLNSFTDIIIKHQGIIDKYIGDCVMAFWGSPYSTAEDETLACSAALECINALEPINQEFAKENIPPISMRIGLNSGYAIAGNLGSDRLFDYTVIGDTVNLASRLEGVNKKFGTKIIASEETLNRTGNQFLTRQLGRIEVKGKTMPVVIYEVMSYRLSASNTHVEAQQLFQRALSLFYDKNPSDALLCFKEMSERYPEDRATIFYKQWCGELLLKETLTEQDLVIKMKEK